MEEVGRAIVEGPVGFGFGFGFHGTHVPERGQGGALLMNPYSKRCQKACRMEVLEVPSWV